MIISFVHQRETILLIMYNMYTKCLTIIPLCTLTIVCTWYEERPL